MYGGISSESTPQTMITTVDLSSYIPASALFLSRCIKSVGNDLRHTPILGLLFALLLPELSRTLSPSAL